MKSKCWWRVNSVFVFGRQDGRECCITMSRHCLMALMSVLDPSRQFVCCSFCRMDGGLKAWGWTLLFTDVMCGVTFFTLIKLQPKVNTFDASLRCSLSSPAALDDNAWEIPLSLGITEKPPEETHPRPLTQAARALQLSCFLRHSLFSHKTFGLIRLNSLVLNVLPAATSYAFGKLFSHDTFNMLILKNCCCSSQTRDGGFTLGSNHHQEMVARTFQEREKTAGQSLRRKVTTSGIHLVVCGSWCVSRKCCGPTIKVNKQFKVTRLLQIRAVGWHSWLLRDGFQYLSMATSCVF